jgi:CRISPR-associated endonuclease/helicase Cas3
MTTIRLLPHAEKLAADNPLGLARHPLYHQMRTLEALRNHDLVMSTYNTGAGKTIASLLHLFDLNGTGKNVLFIAPTNALLAQHAADIERFVADNKLDFKVLRVTAAEMRAIEREQRPGHRTGETLQQLIHNYLEFDTVAVRRQPIILVVNPDIFYYALYFRYAAHDRRNVFERFLTAFDYMVVDEFHYYDAKQLANFLFAFALFDQFGYFEVRQRKICLLSATPAQSVVMYLDRIFGQRWTRIGPDNEPTNGEALETTPALTALTVEIAGVTLEDWLDQGAAVVQGWLRQGQDGAIISSSLASINAAYARLRRTIDVDEIGRITGPEPEEERQRATIRRLILATPTVDIGYNFAKLDKTRQPIDFIVCDARYGDELLQRIGRAGRVLGQAETTAPSAAVVVLPNEAAAVLAEHDGKTLTRSEFAALIRTCSQLPPKHSLTGYIRSHAITECFWPIYQIGKMLPPDLQSEVDDLFERVRVLFAPDSRRTPGGLKGFFRKFEKREVWLAATCSGRMPLDRDTAEHMADWLAWMEPETGRIEPASLQPHLAHLLSDEAQRQDLRAFVQSQVEVTRALFAFRDSFQGPTAVFYDPQHLLSSQNVNAYDLFHLLRNYEMSALLSRAEFEHIAGDIELSDNFYVRLLRQRRPRLVIEFAIECSEERETFERQWCGAPVALRGVRLQARMPGGDLLAGAFDSQIVAALTERFLPMLIVPPESVGIMIGHLRGTNLWAQRLTVRFADGTLDERYRVLLGVAAFHAHAELQWHFLQKDKLKPEAIIL